MKRREFLTLPAASLGGVLVYTLEGGPVRLVAHNGGDQGAAALFHDGRRARRRGGCDRIFPSDATGPGSREAGVVVYIDRQLAGPYGRDKYRYTKPPFVESVPELPRGTKPG